VPHFDGDNWNYIKGAFMTIDRPYGAIFDFLHHRIGSTTSPTPSLIAPPIFFPVPVRNLKPCFSPLHTAPKPPSMRLGFRVLHAFAGASEFRCQKKVLHGGTSVVASSSALYVALTAPQSDTPCPARL
jgi:hypothetical protein